MDFQDVNIKCVTCGREFIFTAREQEFFASKGFKEPRHCRECRQKRKQERDQAFTEVSGGAQKSGGREIFQIVCAQCQRETTVPFKPITGKPVLCKDCFIAQRYGTQAPKPDEKEQTESAASKPAEPEVEQPSAVSKAIPKDGGQIDLASVVEEKETAKEKTASKLKDTDDESSEGSKDELPVDADEDEDQGVVKPEPASQKVRKAELAEEMQVADSSDNSKTEVIEPSEDSEEQQKDIESPPETRIEAPGSEPPVTG